MFSGRRMEESAPTLNLADVRRTIEPLYEGQKLFTGESVMAHAEGVVDILRGIRDDDDLLAAAYLFCVWNQLKNPKEWLTKHFGKQVCELVANLKVVIDVSEKARSREGEARISQQPDAVRRLLLALCTDLRVVLLRLASRLQTLRYFAATKAPGAKEYGAETLALYAPLANRLGIWQMKWELEDLSLRFTEPEVFHTIANNLEETREERVASIQEAVRRIQALLASRGIQASVSGRPKHIYSIWKKMCKKNLKFEQLFDVRAIRIIVDSVEKCYETLSLIQESFEVLSKEFDDYIAKPYAIEELLARIRAVTRRLGRIEEECTLTFEDLVFLPEHRELRYQNASVSLSKKESSLLEYFFRNPGRTLNREVILGYVWGASSEVEDGNLDNYIYFLRRRLRTLNAPVKITTVHGVGYRLEKNN